VRKRVFPSKAYGRIDEDEVKHTQAMGIMCREQGLRITNDLARLTKPSERNVDYGQMAHTMKSTDIKRDLLDDEMAFTALM